MIRRNIVRWVHFLLDELLSLSASSNIDNSNEVYPTNGCVALNHAIFRVDGV